MSRLSWVCMGALAWSVGCGGTVVLGSGGNGGGSSTNVGTTVATTSTSTGVTGSCPAAPPTDGAPCSPEGHVCSFGADPRPTCRDTSSCTNGKWVVTHPQCAKLPGVDVCGTAPSPDQPCATMGDFCAYPDGTDCGCSACGGLCGPPPPHWQCNKPMQGCDITLPNSGSHCSQEGLLCVYGQPCGVSGVQMTCTQGEWVWQLQQACPD